MFFLLVLHPAKPSVAHVFRGTPRFFCSSIFAKRRSFIPKRFRFAAGSFAQLPVLAGRAFDLSSRRSLARCRSSLTQPQTCDERPALFCLLHTRATRLRLLSFRTSDKIHADLQPCVRRRFCCPLAVRIGGDVHARHFLGFYVCIRVAYYNNL